MKTSELRERRLDETKTGLGELLEENFNLRFQHVAGQLRSPIGLRQVRREMARVRAVLQEHELGLRPLVGGEE